MIRRPPRSTLFPTRRSSDLPPGLVVVDRHLPDLDGQKVCESLKIDLDTNRVPVVQIADPVANGRGSDRKSTRLNSSHANISYAVFCLKQKLISEQHTSELQY